MKNFADSLTSKIRFRSFNPSITPNASILISIMAVAVMLRVAAALYLGNQVETLPGIDDQRSYHMLAQQVIQGHGFTVATNWWPLTHAGQPTAHWSYLYTLYLIGVYSLFGVVPLFARLIQVTIVGIVWPLLTYRIARRMFAENTTSVARATPLIAAAWAAVYPYFVYYSAGLLTESFYIVMVLWTIDLTLSIAAALKTSPAPTGLMQRWLLLGIAIGSAVLLRQLFLILVPFLFMWIAWAVWTAATPIKPKWLTLLQGGVCVAGVVVMFIAPWTFLNYQNFHKFVMLNTNAGFAFFWANHPSYGTHFVDLLTDDAYFKMIPHELYSLDEPGLSSALFQLGLGYVLDDPVRYILLSLSRIQTYFVFWPSPTSGALSNFARITSLGLALPFILYGVFISLRCWRNWALLYVFVAVYTGIHLLSWALVRYRLPVDAVLLVFAAFGLAHLGNRLKFRAPNNIKRAKPIQVTNHLKFLK
jgi:hypothetical protein